MWPAETTRPPSLPGLLQTPEKSEFLWKLKLCLLDQTALGVGAARCQMVSMEGKRQLEGIKLEGVKSLLLPACARLGDCRLQSDRPSVGGSGRARLGEPVCGMLERYGASRQSLMVHTAR